MKLRVGDWDLEFLQAPAGSSGVCEVRYKSMAAQEWSEVARARYRVDVDGIWLDAFGAVSGFDIRAEVSELGGLDYQLSQRNQGISWAGVTVKHAGELEAQAGQGNLAVKKGIKVKAQMPGKIIRLGIAVGESVVKDQALLVMEAMKMENEIKATKAGVIKSIHVVEGQVVETGALLIMIE